MSFFPSNKDKKIINLLIGLFGESIVGKVGVSQTETDEHTRLIAHLGTFDGPEVDLANLDSLTDDDPRITRMRTELEGYTFQELVDAVGKPVFWGALDTAGRSFQKKIINRENFSLVEISVGDPNFPQRALWEIAAIANEL